MRTTASSPQATGPDHDPWPEGNVKSGSGRKRAMKGEPDDLSAANELQFMRTAGQRHVSFPSRDLINAHSIQCDEAV